MLTVDREFGVHFVLVERIFGLYLRRSGLGTP